MSDVHHLFREFVRLDRKRRLGLSPAELERWRQLKRRLARQLQPDLTDEQADRRASIRVPTRLEVHFPRAADLARCRLTTLSRTGVFIATPTPAPIGSKLVLCIVVDETGDSFEAQAEVVSQNLGPRFEARPGMGLRFTDLSAAAQEKLDALYEATLQREVEQRHPK